MKTFSGELSGHIAIGHTRYSTTGSSIVVNAQPLLERTELGDFAFAHNGNLTNTDELRQGLAPTTVLQASSDSEVMAKLIVESKGACSNASSRCWRAHAVRIGRAVHQRRTVRVPRSVGCSSALFGQLSEGGYVVASESCALGTIGAQYMRELERGEILRIGSHGLESHRVKVDDA